MDSPPTGQGPSGYAACGPHRRHAAPLETTEHMVHEEPFLPVKMVERQVAPGHRAWPSDPRLHRRGDLPPTHLSPCSGGLSCSAPLCPRPSEGTMCLAVLSRVGLEAPPACLPIFLDRSFFPPSWCCRTRLGVLYLGPSHTCLPSPPAAPQISSPLLAWLSPRPQPGSARDLPPSVCMNPPNTADLRCCASPPSRDQDRRWSGQVPGVPSQSPQSVK